MTWRKRLAKEWLWLTGTVAATLVGWTVFCFFYPHASVDLYWRLLLKGHERVTTFTVIPIGCVYFLRFTVWSIKQAKRG